MRNGGSSWWTGKVGTRGGWALLVGVGVVGGGLAFAWGAEGREVRNVREARSQAATGSSGPVERAASPLVGATESEDEERDFEGMARARLDAGSYLYFEVEDAHGARRWVATLKTSDARVGDRVRVSTYATRERFESRRLGRRFERLWFGRVRPLDDGADDPG